MKVRIKFFYAILIIAVIFFATGCSVPPILTRETPTATPIATTTPTATPPPTPSPAATLIPSPAASLTQAEIESAEFAGGGKYTYGNGVSIGIIKNKGMTYLDGVVYIEIETEITAPQTQSSQGVSLPTYGEMVFKTSDHVYPNATFEPDKVYLSMSNPKIRIYSESFDSQRGNIIIKYQNKILYWYI